MICEIVLMLMNRMLNYCVVELLVSRLMLVMVTVMLSSRCI